MRRIMLIIAALSLSAAYAQKAPLKTSDVALDADDICWVRGPANKLEPVGPITGKALTVTATTVLPTAGFWLIKPTTGNPTIVNANGTSTQAGAAGTAYPL